MVLLFFGQDRSNDAQVHVEQVRSYAIDDNAHSLGYLTVFRLNFEAFRALEIFQKTGAARQMIGAEAYSGDSRIDKEPDCPRDLRFQW